MFTFLTAMIAWLLKQLAWIEWVGWFLENMSKYISSHILKGSLVYSASYLPNWYNDHSSLNIENMFLGQGGNFYFAVTEKSVLAALNLRRGTIYACTSLFQILCNVTLKRENFLVLKFYLWLSLCSCFS
jgi:hypothetical protein